MVDNFGNRRLKKSVPRERGRFRSYLPVTDASKLKTTRMRCNRIQKESTNQKLFDGFVRLFFLVGTATDWVPSSSKTGPLVTLAEILFKPVFLLTRQERSKKVNLIFAGGDPSKVAPIIRRISTRDAAVPVGSTSRVTVFCGRRLPIVENYTTEIEPVRTWVQNAFEQGALRFNSVDEAFTACLNKIKTYVVAQGKHAYIGYPKTSDLTSNTPEENTVDQGDVRFRENGSIDVYSELVRDNSDDFGNDPENVRASQGCDERTSTGGKEAGGRIDSSDEETIDLIDDTLEQTGADQLFQMAQDDRTYIVMSLFLDESLKTNFDLVAASTLDRERKKKLHIPPLLKDLLIFAHCKGRRIKDPAAQRQREEKLKWILEALTMVREAYGLKTFSQMRCAYE